MTAQNSKVQLPEHDQYQNQRESLMVSKGIERYHSKNERKRDIYPTFHY